jgi:hypothetical protein
MNFFGGSFFSGEFFRSNKFFGGPFFSGGFFESAVVVGAEQLLIKLRSFTERGRF